MAEITFLLGISLFLFIVANIQDWLGFQSKRFGTAELQKKTSLLRRSFNGLVIDGKRRLSVNNSVKHLLLVAPTGSGKTTNFVYSNLLKLQSSFVTIDIKGELFSLISPTLKKQGYTVKVIDLSDITKSLRYNPLKRLHLDSDIREFCQSLYEMSNNGAKTEGIWMNGAITILEIIIRCLRNTGSEFMNMANLIHLLNAINIANQAADLESFVAMFGRSAENNDTIDMFNSWRNQELKIMAGQHASALSAMTSQFDFTSLKQLTNGDDFDFQEFRKSKVALFIKVPVGKMVAYSGFLTVFFSQFFDYFLSHNPEDGDETIYCILEEFGNLKRIKNFGQICSLIRSQKVSLSIIAQDITQIDNIYSQNEANTIISNCSSHLILPGIMNGRTLDYYQKLIGVETSEELDENGRIHVNKRELLTNDELRRLKAREGIFLFSNQNPVKVRMTPLYKNRLLMAKSGIVSKNNKLVSTLPPIEINSQGFNKINYIDLEWLKQYIQKHTTQKVEVSTDR